VALTDHLPHAAAVHRRSEVADAFGGFSETFGQVIAAWKCRLYLGRDPFLQRPAPGQEDKKVLRLIGEYADVRTGDRLLIDAVWYVVRTAWPVHCSGLSPAHHVEGVAEQLNQ
jgi:hypothetical protein